MKRQKTLPCLKFMWQLGSIAWHVSHLFKEIDALTTSRALPHLRIRERHDFEIHSLFERPDPLEEALSIQAETTRLINEQQRQINKLTELLAKKSSTPDDVTQQFSSRASQIPLPPLKVMLFIDGTWLYYSLHAREDTRCPIQKRFGPGWQYKYNIDWDNLPRVIGKALQQQDMTSGWMPVSSEGEQAQGRAVEVIRVHVYTSYRQDTPKTSIRYQMFQDMIKAKYDVLMLETIGHNEKCVDIQLAVDMLHFATVPDAYDVALLLTGDKDFIPAMVRTRQKGRRVGLVSMKAYSTRAFYETPGIKDYDPIWLDEYLDQIIKPRANAPHLQGGRPLPQLSMYTIMKVVSDFIRESQVESISSRDIGRYIKTITIGNRCMLDEVKEIYGGLYQFLIVSGIFSVDNSTPIRDYWVGLDEKVTSQELDKSRERATLSEAEDTFFQSYSTQRLQNRQKYYAFTLAGLGLLSEEAKNAPPLKNDNDYYNQMKLSDLKEICRERGLKVSGKKSDLLERILANVVTATQEEEPISALEVKLNSTTYLEELLLEYLHASGGKASSRDVGRYLTANKPSPAMFLEDPTVTSALGELKRVYGSLRQFIAQSGRFRQEDMEGGESYEFLVRPRTNT